MTKTKHISIKNTFETRHAAGAKRWILKVAALSAKLALLPTNSPDRQCLEVQLYGMQSLLDSYLQYPNVHLTAAGN